MKKITTALLLAFLCVSYATAAPRLKAGDRIVTLGDSITQAGGYQALMQKVLARFYPDLGVEIVNAGIGGHKAPDMAARLQKDVIDKKPTIVTVSCGVNDVWHGFYNPPRGVDLETYTRLMTQIVQQLKANTTAAIYLLTPTVIHENVRGPENLELEAYCQAIREIAQRENVLPVLTVTAPVVAALRWSQRPPILQSCVVRTNGPRGNIRRFQNLSCGDFQCPQDRGCDQEISRGLHGHAIRGRVKLRRSADLCAAGTAELPVGVFGSADR